jgi:hypothetical protein
MSFEFASHIVAATPLWIFFLFAYLVRQGYQRLRPQVSSFRRMLLVPAIFIAWGLYGLYQRSTGDQDLLVWLAAAAGGSMLGAVTSPRHLRVDRWRNLVLQPGSILPLLRYALLFGGHYGLNIAMAMRPEARPVLVLWDIAVSGLGAGYFLGWISTAMLACRTAPEADLSTFQSTGDATTTDAPQV